MTRLTLVRRAFTLIELMVAMSITIVIVVLLASMVGSVSNLWRKGQDQTETFAAARGAMSLIGHEMQGMVIDLDLGYAVQETKGDPNNIVLKFLSRRQPSGTTVAGVEKIAYQLAWASDDILPTVTPLYDTGHTVPVLIRTSNFQTLKGLNEVFNVTGGKQAWSWIRDWGTLTTEVQTGIQSDTGDITEVMADNVLQWKVNPVFWDSSGAKPIISVDSPPGRYYDDMSNQEAAKYITSDLKYVRKEDPNNPSYYTPDSAPRAIEIHLATVPYNALGRLSALNTWANVRSETGLFDISKLGASPLDKQLLHYLTYFQTTYYLYSRTP